MPEHLRALVLILVVATTVFLLAKKPLTAFAVPEEDFIRRRNLWFGVTLLAFLSHSFWLFLGLTAVLLLRVGKSERVLLAVYTMLMFAVPPFSAKLSGLGVFNQLLVLDYARMLSLTLLLPAALRMRKASVPGQKGVMPTDLLVLGFLATQLGLRFTVDSTTNTLRYAVYAWLDTWLPYYVASRSLRSVSDFREVLVSFVCGVMVMSVIAMFEALRYWLPYTSLIPPLGVQFSLGNYLSRGSFLRAQVTTGQPIVLGCIFVVAIAGYAYIRRGISQKSIWWVGLMSLIGGLIATFSRGPWMAALAAVLIFRFTMPQAAGGLLKLVAGLGLVASLVWVSPYADQVREYLPFVGSIETENVDYRQRLFDVSVQLIWHGPWFGSFDYMYALIDADLVIGGMVDIVNTYIGIGLANGIVGLACFASAFLLASWQVWRAMCALPDPFAEIHTLGSGLLACVAGIMMTIFTVSSISFIPMVCWLFLGLAVGFVRLCRDCTTSGVEMPSVWVDSQGRPAGQGGVNAAW